MRTRFLVLGIVLVLAGCDLNPVDEGAAGGGGGGGGGCGSGGGGGGYMGPICLPGGPIGPIYSARIVPSGSGAGRVTFPEYPGNVCMFANDVVRSLGPLGTLQSCPVFGVAVLDSITLVAEPLWFARFGGWSAGCEPANQPTCRLLLAELDWVPQLSGATAELRVRFDVTGPPPLTAVSGNDQYGSPGDTLALPVVVQLRDSLDRPVANEVLEFKTDEADGSFVPATGTTDANGQVTTTWILGSRFADQTGRVSATSESLWYATLELRAIVIRRGSVTVTTQTVGANPDSDGYRIVVDHWAHIQAIGANAIRSVLDLRAGDHTLELQGVAANCRVQQNPRVVTIVIGVTLHTEFVVQCQ